ncbi:MAG: hypothetical protein WDM92_05185 [Caulobacteraceae bacterium]
MDNATGGAAPGFTLSSAANVKVGKTDVTGPNSSSLLGASVAAPSQAQGKLGHVGVVSGGAPVSVGTTK